MQEEGIFQVHYHLLGESHSMDALIKNKCEHEIIAIINQVNRDFGLSLKLESFADGEGGLRQFWKLFEDPANAQYTITGVFSVIVAVIVLIGTILNSPDKPTAATEQLNEKLLELKVLQESIKAQKELEGLLEKRQSLDAPQKNERGPLVNTNFVGSRGYEKIISHRSNFYKFLQPYSKVTGVGFSWSNDKHNFSEEIYVHKAYFPDFIQPEKKLQPQIIDNATIEIVAPVITDGTIQWKGIFNGESIRFSMKDKKFKEDVVNRLVDFKSGDAIECVLEIEHKYNEAGEKVFGSYTVSEVFGKVEMHKNHQEQDEPNKKISSMRAKFNNYAKSKDENKDLNMNLNLNFDDI